MSEEFVFGRNSVEALLKSSGRSVNKLFVMSGIKSDGRISAILRLAGEQKIPITEVSRQKLQALAGDNANHQGIVAGVSPVEYCDLDDLTAEIEHLGNERLLLILDNVEDPQNLGAIIRSAEVLGAHGVIIPKRRAAGVTSVVAKISSGAVEFIKIAQVTNLVATVETLKNQGYWIIGAEYEQKSQYIYNVDYKMPVALVMGSEGKGISKLLKSSCDILVKIPQIGKTTSLNVSSASSIILYEIQRQRTKN